MSTVSIWSNALFEAVCIASPLVLSATPSYRKRAAIKGWRLILAIALLLFILFSPFSFAGTKLDYLVCALLASSIAASFLTREVAAERIVVPSAVIGILVMLAYTPGKALFGSRPWNVQAKDGLVYTTDEIPDMVAAPQYTMNVDRRWLILEQQLWRSRVRPHCNSFTYDEIQEELVVRDTCQADTQLPR